ncbi:MAG: glycerate kinase [Chloroflexi bacterium]|nr:glycerate kinase [Chloroflexota bacterium]
MTDQGQEGGARDRVLSIFQAALQASDSREAVQRTVKRDGDWLTIGKLRYDLTSFRSVCLVGAGKATAAMAHALEQVLDGHLESGIIIVKEGHGLQLQRTIVREAAHPVPDTAGETASRELLDFVSQCRSDDLLLCAFSGGGSALLVAPAPPISLSEKQQLTQLLLRAGCTIDEVNAVRKHCSLVKGGQLARAAHGATIMTLALSDVIGNRLDVIASGPTVPDTSTYEQALGVLDRYGLRRKVPPSVLQRLLEGCAGTVPETPKPGESFFEHCAAVIIGSVDLACQAAAAAAVSLGYDTSIVSTTLTGEARDAAAWMCSLTERRQSERTGPVCLIAGGETTVTVRGTGLGGRNQELTLAAAHLLQGSRGITLAALATDGSDGPTDAAGAIVSGDTAAALECAGVSIAESLTSNDAYHALDQIGALVKTGPTGTNVNDLTIVLMD